MELRNYLRLLRERAILIVVTALVGASLAYTLSNSAPLYSSTSTIYVGARQFAFDDLSLEIGRTASIAQVAQTFSKMIASEPIAQEALARTGIARSARAVVAQTETEVETGTSLIRITVSDPSPATARSLANALAEAFVAQVVDFEPTSEAPEGSVPALPAYIFDRADLSTTPASTGRLQSTVLGGVLGLAIAIAIVLLLDFLDVSAKSTEQVERRLGLPVLGAIPASRQLGSRALADG